MKSLKVALSVLALFCGPGQAVADIVLLKNGNKFEGEVREFEDKIEVKMPNGATLPIPRSQVEKIVKMKLPTEELEERKASLDTDSADALFAMAQWCRANSFNDECETYLQAALRISPEHADAKQALYSYQKTYKSIPTNQVAIEKLEKEFGPDFKLLQTKRFRVCYNTDTAFVDHRAGLFDLVYRAFYGYFEEKKFPVTTLSDRLEVVLFDSRQEFQRYASQENPALASSAGYYSPLKNRVAFYNSVNDPNFEKQKQMILAAERQVQAIQKQLAQTDAQKFTIRFNDGKTRTLSKQGTMSFLAGERRKIQNERRKLADFYKRENVTTTVHECMHQLAFNLGVQKITGDCPKWVGEGLAMFFETATAGSLLQIGKVNGPRLDHFKKARQAGPLIPLNVLVVRDDLFDVSTPVAITAYAEAWGLTHFLLKNKEQATLRYLQVLANKQLAAPPTPESRLKDFTDAFGQDIPALEKQWLAYMDSL